MVYSGQEIAANLNKAYVEIKKRELSKLEETVQQLQKRQEIKVHLENRRYRDAAQLAEKLGDYKLAVKYYLKDQFISYFDPILRIAEAYWKIGDKKEAIKIYEKALKVHEKRHLAPSIKGNRKLLEIKEKGTFTEAGEILKLRWRCIDA